MKLSQVIHSWHYAQQFFIHTHVQYTFSLNSCHTDFPKQCYPLKGRSRILKILFNQYGTLLTYFCILFPSFPFSLLLLSLSLSLSLPLSISSSFFFLHVQIQNTGNGMTMLTHLCSSALGSYQCISKCSKVVHLAKGYRSLHQHKVARQLGIHQSAHSGIDRCLM